MPEAPPRAPYLLSRRLRALARLAARAVMPRSLLWSTFLLITLLLVLALTAWSQIFRHFEEAPRTQDLARMVVSVVNLTRTALINAAAARRQELLIDLAALEGIRIYPAEAGDQLTPLPDTRSMDLLTAEVRRQLGSQTRFAGSWEGLDGFWVSFRLDPEDRDEFWVMLPRERLQRPHALEWLSWAGAALLLSLLGAYLVVNRISAPLRSIARAAREVGRGRTPEHLAESGPQEITDVAHAFNQMAGDLARIDADRALILAGVSHDLRTPLARLRLGVEMSGAPGSEVDAMVADIEEMDRIIGQFLDFGRGDPQEPPQPTDLAALVRDVIEPYQLRGVVLELNLPDQLELPLRALPVRRALRNLLDNALRYAGEDKPLSITLRQSEQGVDLEVADRGPGIPVAEAERMKRPFTRMESARSNTKGSGLGLAIVNRVVRAHDGQLQLLPREGGGLRAVLHFPARLRSLRERLRSAGVEE